jgi:DNA-binding SARP family transcriptional activator
VVEFSILGPLQVESEHGALRLGGPRQRATLAILLLNADRVVPVERLADELYAGEPPATAVTQVQRQISELRKVLGSEVRLDTSPPGYVLRLEPDQLDLTRFERLLQHGVDALELGDAPAGRRALVQALELWRGAPLADLADEPFAQAAIGRLEDLRLAALERRIGADLELGGHREVVAELDELVRAEPLREGFVAQLVLALYRSGRQADALSAYRRHRAHLADELGLEPAPELRELESAILRQDDALALGRASRDLARPTVIAVAVDGALSPSLLGLAADEGRDTILLHLVSDAAGLGDAAAAVGTQCRDLAGAVRGAAFVTTEWGDDLVRTARAHEAALVLIDATPLVAGSLSDALRNVLEHCPADVGLVVRGEVPVEGAGVFVPFGGGEHDWAALEVAAAFAAKSRLPLRLVGTGATPERGLRDSSRLLADASLAVQQAVGVTSTPLLSPPTTDALLVVVEPASIVIAGVGSRWRTEGLDAVHAALASDARPPVVLIRRGLRPGILAPEAGGTRFTWSLQV